MCSSEENNIVDENRKIKITIDGVETEVAYGTTVLQAARDLGIYIPTLCYHEDLCVAGSCRLCMVEAQGSRKNKMQASCCFPVFEEMEIVTNSARIRKARQTIVDMMISQHIGECYNCPKNGNCELQKLAELYGSGKYTFRPASQPQFEVDNSSKAVVRDMNKCVKCGRCVRACGDMLQVGAIHMDGRGAERKVQTMGDLPLGSSKCISCGQCVTHCPVGALSIKSQEDMVWAAIDNPNKHVVVQTAPAVRVAIAEEFGYAPGQLVTKEMVTALRKIGFDKVFDTNFGADMTIVEEGVELLQRLKKRADGEDVVFPQMTSCCPGWVAYVENYYPEFIPNLSTTKSPIQIQGAAIKTYYAEKNGINPEDIVSVSMTPCTAKKVEASREEMNDSGYQDIDFSITTREAARMMKKAGVRDITKEKQENYDDIFGQETGSGVIFGATGGVMESALRTVLELVTGDDLKGIFEHADIKPVRGFDGIKSATVSIDKVVDKVPEFIQDAFDSFDFLKGAKIKVVVANGIGNAKVVLESIKNGEETFKYTDFLEVMTCPGGCLAGGGQPVPINNEVRKGRMEGLYKLDEISEVRESYKNPAVIHIYDEFIKGCPSSEKAHHLFHTSYVNRKDEVCEEQDPESCDCDPSKCGSCKLKEPVKEDTEYKV